MNLAGVDSSFNSTNDGGTDMVVVLASCGVISFEYG